MCAFVLALEPIGVSARGICGILQGCFFTIGAILTAPIAWGELQTQGPDHALPSIREPSMRDHSAGGAVRHTLLWLMKFTTLSAEHCSWWGLRGHAGVPQWRPLVALAALPMAMYMLLFPAVQESPRWLLVAGRKVWTWILIWQMTQRR